MARPILLVDTFSLFFRAHHALPPMTTSRGEATGALYGLAALLLKLLREQRPLGLTFALDGPEPTFRHASYAAYKATRPAVPDALASQLDRLPALLAATGAPALRAPGFEADDVLATLALELERDGHEPLIVSGDRDLLQVVSERARVHFVGARGQPARLYDVGRVEQRFGVPPEALPTWQALVGDPSDNLPGVAGIGPTTAARLIREHGPARGILAARPALPPKLARLLAPAEATLEAHEALARLRRDVPLGPGARHAALDDDARQRLRELFSELEFASLLARLDALPASGSRDP